jgi:hypothetical protein
LPGAQLIALRDTNGKVGLLHNNCPQRGNCIDMPNEPADGDFKRKVKAVADRTLEDEGWYGLLPGASFSGLNNTVTTNGVTTSAPFVISLNHVIYWLAQNPSFDWPTMTYAQYVQFFHLFIAPGVAHCGGGVGAAPADPFGALVDWVEHHNAPRELLGVRRDSSGNVVLTRPVCMYGWRHVGVQGLRRHQ